MAAWTPDKERILKLISEDLDTIAEKVFGHAGPYDGDDLMLRIEELVEPRIAYRDEPWKMPIAIPSCAWEDCRESIGGRWPVALAVFDLRFWAEQEAQGHRRPSERALAKAWGWSSSVASKFIRIEPWQSPDWVPYTRRRT